MCCWQGRTDNGLNPTGAQQAHALAAFLAGEPLGAIVTSPLKRAAATADAVAALHPTAARGTDARFCEMGFGSFEGEVRATAIATQPIAAQSSPHSHRHTHRGTTPAAGRLYLLATEPTC